MAQTILITGGAGFIGINAAIRFLKDGWKVIIFDNLSRKGSKLSLASLKRIAPQGYKFVQGDIRYHAELLSQVVAKSDVVLHLAAQVAVTFSIQDPRLDFETNALGTFNVLEAIRKANHKPLLIYASTNKVYGETTDFPIILRGNQYAYENLPNGVSEKAALDFHSPYGCSKGAADQYVRDYARIYDLPTVVFRQSCIYGPHQFGIEDQGWVAWFTIASVLGTKITIYGDGKQARDLLYIDDLVDLYQLAIARSGAVKGEIFNVGGGPRYTMSLLELVAHLEEMLGHKIKYRFSSWRPGDQKIYVSDIRKAQEKLSWHPRIDPREGVKRLLQWVRENQEIFPKLF